MTHLPVINEFFISLSMSTFGLKMMNQFYKRYMRQRSLGKCDFWHLRDREDTWVVSLDVQMAAFLQEC